MQLECRVLPYLAVEDQAVVWGAADDGHALAGAVKFQDVEDLVLHLCQLVSYLPGHLKLS